MRSLIDYYPGNFPVSIETNTCNSLINPMVWFNRSFDSINTKENGHQTKQPKNSGWHRVSTDGTPWIMESDLSQERERSTWDYAYQADIDKAVVHLKHKEHLRQCNWGWKTGATFEVDCRHGKFRIGAHANHLWVSSFISGSISGDGFSLTRAQMAAMVWW